MEVPHHGRRRRKSKLKSRLARTNEHDGPMFKMHDDPRVTSVGRWLRRYSLDELPQLFNVLVGQMSLVGPRPPLPEEVADYDDRREAAAPLKPGMTGLWQVSGRVRPPVGGVRPARPALRRQLVGGLRPRHPLEDRGGSHPRTRRLLGVPSGRSRESASRDNAVPLRRAWP